MRELRLGTHHGQGLFLLFILLLCISWSGCNKPQNSPAVNFEEHPLYRQYQFSNDEKTIEIGVPTPWATVSHLVEIMKRDEILKEDLRTMGYTVKFYPFLKGEEINYFLKKGVLEGTIMGDVPTLKMAAEGNITVFSLFHKGSVSLVSRDFYRVKDLKHKRIAFPAGSIAHLYLLELLKTNGMSLADIRPVPMDTRDMFEAIEQGKLDALTSFEPMPTVYTRIDPTLHIIHRSFSTYGFFSMRKGYAARHPRAIKALIAAQFRAVAWLQESDRNVDRASRWAAAESAKVMPLPLGNYITALDRLCSEDLLNDVDAYETTMHREILADDGQLQKEFELLSREGLIPRERTWKDVRSNIDTELLFQVLKNTRPAASRILP